MPQAVDATLVTEDCNIHYWSRGTGPLLIFVPGGNGHGRQYNALMDIMQDTYTVATFDRRQMSASLPLPTSHNKPWNPVQQARDIIAVMHALSFTTASVFASSGGCTNALQLALSYPDTITTLILHEPALVTLLPPAESTELIDFTFSLKELYQKEGIEAAMKAFGKKILVGMDDGLPRQQPEKWNPINQLENEIPSMGMYCPDLVQVKANMKGKRVVVAVGRKSAGAMYVTTGRVCAERLGCAVVEFVGHHQGFETESEEFAPVLREVLEGEYHIKA